MHIAYLTGLMDGEGSIMLLGQGRGRNRAPQISIGMTEPEPVEAACAAYGGRIDRKPGREGRQSMHNWRLRGNAAVDLLSMMLPYFVIERRKALAEMLVSDPIVTSYARGPGNSKVAHNEALYQRMKARNAVRLTELPQIASRRPTAADIAYLAGILDGEGHIGPKLRLEVASTDAELPAWLTSRFGGGCYGPTTQRSDAWRPMFRWSRAPTGFEWAARVADHMLIDRKKARVASAEGFKRTALTVYDQPSEFDGDYLALRAQGVRPAVAIRESGIQVVRARELERRRTGRVGR